MDSDLEAVLEYIKHQGNCDLTVYKELTLNRRLQCRMRTLTIKSYSDYLKYLKANPQEIVLLFETILINYTSFFRNRSAWDYIAEQIIPQIESNKQPHEPIRVWSAGCASGEEAYTLAIILAEVLGMEQYLQRVQIFATDADKSAIKEARQGSYSKSKVANVPPDLLEKYFEQTDDCYVFEPKLRRKIVFGNQNLIEDPAISKLDLLVCRNALIYFNQEAQSKVLYKLHLALNINGFLFLGNAETLLGGKYNFTPVSIQHRIFTKERQITRNDYLLSQSADKRAIEHLSVEKRFFQPAFKSSASACIAVN